MQETVLGIALVAIAAGIFKLISPENSFKKQIAFLTSAFFLLSCVSLIKGNDLDFSEMTESFRQEGGYVDLSVEAYEMTEREIASNIAKNIDAILQENEIFCDEIRVIIDISSSYSISIKQVRLAFSVNNADYAAAAEQLIKKEVGEKIEIVIEIKGQ